MPTTRKKRSFVATANEALVGTLTTLGGFHAQNRAGTEHRSPLSFTGLCFTNTETKLNKLALGLKTLVWDQEKRSHS